MKKIVLQTFALVTTWLGLQLNASAMSVEQLDEIRIKSRVQGITVGIVRGEEPLQFLSSGFADKEKRLPITANTQFRMGSVSKMIVALSIMKLVEQGHLSLDDTLHSLAPEIAFTNPYQTKYPLRVVHLLNHTTGWDAMRFAEKRSLDNPPVSIEAALNILPESRTSRWPPGTRTAYNNTGPLVAAYLVEKISGMRYESFVKEHFLTPLKMKHTDYFFSDDYRQHAAKLYIGNKEMPYQHMNNRAAGGLNSSIEDMVKFIRFLNNPANTQEEQLLSSDALIALQQAQGSLAAKAGLEITTLPGLQQFQANGVMFFGHEGSVRGGSALLAYQPSLNVGYVIAINGEGPALPAVHKALLELLTQSSIQQTSESASFSVAHQRQSGWYKNISPISDRVALFVQLLPWKLSVSEQAGFIKPTLGGPARKLQAGDNGQFLQNNSRQVVAVTVNDPLAGPVLHYGPLTLQPVSAISAWMPLIVGIIWAFSGLLAIMTAFWWLPVSWIKKQRYTATHSIRLWPLVTFLQVPFTVALLMIARSSINLTQLLGQPSWLTIGIMLTTLLFFVLSLWSVVTWWRCRKEVEQRFAHWHAMLLTTLNLVVALYLLSYGLIGIRLWT